MLESRSYFIKNFSVQYLYTMGVYKNFKVKGSDATCLTEGFNQDFENLFHYLDKEELDVYLHLGAQQLFKVASQFCLLTNLQALNIKVDKFQQNLEGFKELCITIGSLQNLLKVSLEIDSNTHIGERGIECLCQSLKNLTSLESLQLNFGKVQICTDNAISLGEALYEMKSLSTLRLEIQSIGSVELEGIERICQGILSSVNNLTNLALKFEDFSDVLQGQGVISIANCLNKLEKLREVALVFAVQKELPKGSVIQQILGTLSQKQSLNTLIFKYDNYQYQAGYENEIEWNKVELKDLFQHNRDLKKLYLQLFLSDQLRQNFYSSLSSLQNLQQLSLSLFQVSNESEQLSNLGLAISQLKQLQICYIYCKLPYYSTWSPQQLCSNLTKLDRLVFLSINFPPTSLLQGKQRILKLPKVFKLKRLVSYCTYSYYY